MTRPRGSGAPWVLAGAVLWGTTGTAQALAPPGAHPLTVGAMRLAVGAAALLALALLRRTRAWPGAGALRPVLAAAVGIAAYQPLFFAGVAATGVAVGTMVAIGSAPVVAGVLGWLLRGERPGRRWVGATALALCGCWLLAGGAGGLRVEGTGLVLAVGAGAAYAGYTAASKQLLERYAPDAVAATTFGLAALLLAPLLLRGDLAWLGEPRGLVVALHLGLLATASAYVLFNRGLARLPVATAATLTLAEPLTAAVLGVVVLGERPDAASWAGMGLLALALALLTAGGGARDPAPPRLVQGPEAGLEW